MKRLYASDPDSFDWAWPQEFRAEEARPRMTDGLKGDGLLARFLRRNAVLLLALAGLIVWTWVTTAITRHNAVEETTEKLTAAFAIEKEKAVQAVRDEYAAARFLSGEASLQAAMEQEAGWISKVLYGMKDNNEKDLRTAVWCILSRVDNPWYPNSVEDVCRQKDQWMGYSGDNPVLTNLKDLALEELAVWHNGERPVSQEYVYLYWTPQKVTLRDSFTDGSTTNYWRYGQ